MQHSWSCCLHYSKRGGGGDERSQLSSLPTYTVQGPSQGIVPPTEVGSSHLKQIKITPHRHTQRPDSQLILDSVKLTN